jgi:glycerophosphoryl diester phosphodiesterase
VSERLDAIFARPIAHRGLHDGALGIVENTRSAFRAAIEAGFAIECDLQLSRDKVPMVFHDTDLSRLTKLSGPVSGVDSETLEKTPLKGTAETPMRFTDLLALVAGRVPLIVELKPQTRGMLALAKAAVAAARDYEGPLAFKSFEPRLVTGVKKAGFKGPVGVIVDAGTSDAKADDSLSLARRMALRQLVHAPGNQFDFVSCERHALELPAIALLRRVGKKVMAWTVRSHADAAKALENADQIVFEGYVPQTAGG